ncbi:AlwI family type II restriction endonuclease [Holdemanella biformis]|uniref:AlwI family type II restriction endonuclease n=1 Tax=Holdemanella biformis TaxID=1735 RepID=UPI00248F7C77|nr:AlwI family type II restriction endonuclease [Holdemanella biformis]
MLQTMGKEKNKPLSFSTTMRNPNRIASFLNCLVPFEGMTLTNDLIDKVVRKVIKEKLYRPYYINKVAELNEIYTSDDEFFNDEQLEEIVNNSPQNHKEAGFDKGWPSRFDTWYKLPMEFGFVNYAIGSKIEISKVGHMLIDALNENPVNEQKIQNVFLNSMIKYQIRNPYRKNKNDNVPLILLLQVIKKLRDENPDSAGIYRQEISFFICWTNNDADALYNKIKEFRKNHKFGQYTDELIYDECLNIMGYEEKDKNYIKIEKVTGETVDEYIRKMRSTGIISLRGNGRFIDFNNLELEKIKYVLDNYSTYTIFTDKQKYFEYMGKIDEHILDIKRTVVSNEDLIRKATLQKYAENYNSQDIFNELYNVCNKKESKDPVFRIISAPARLEFLTSIALVQNFKDLDVNPNYIIDDEGLPTCTASGGMADIVCYDKINDGLIEVTLMCGRQQVNNELLPISRHLADAKKEKEETVSIFVAPRIHDDVKRYINFIKFDEGLNIIAYGINEFLDVVNNYATLDELVAKE